MNFFSSENCSKSAGFSRKVAAAAHLLHSGGHDRTNRCARWQQPDYPRRNGINSAVSRLFPPASAADNRHKLHFV